MKPKKCVNCGKEFSPFKSTEKACSYQCAIVIGKKKVARDRKRELKDNDISDIKKRLQAEVNAIARAIDFGLPCLAKGIFPNQMHGGHIFSRGAFSNMRYNLHNIHRQSAQSNHYQNEDGLLREKLRKEYGGDYFQFLESCKKSELPNLPASEWLNILSEARKAKSMIQKNVSKPLTVSERIMLRNKANNVLGIYEPEFACYEQKIS